MNAISRMLDRAELYLERGELRNLNAVLNDISERSGEIDMGDSNRERFLALCEEAPEPEEPTSSKCHKCSGSGRYTNEHGQDAGRCFSCVGKGYQSQRDIVREKNYYARKQDATQPYSPTF